MGVSFQPANAAWVRTAFRCLLCLDAGGRRSNHSPGDVAEVAVAANFSAPMQIIAAEIERATGHHALLSPSRPASFYAQIENGAPYDVQFAADDETPARRIAKKSAVSDSAFTDAAGKLVL